MSKDNSKDKHCDYNNFKRTRYFHGMLMTDRDFREEQIYHNEKRKLLNRMLHGWGVVCGLGIRWEQGKSIITIESGMAMDCHGNEIVVCEKYELNISKKVCLLRENPKTPTTAEECANLEETTNQDNKWYIGIKYTEVPTDPVPVYAPTGGCEEKVCEYSRTREGFCVEIFDHPPTQPHKDNINPSLIKRFFDDCKGIGKIHDGEAQGFNPNPITITLSADASATDDFYNGMEVEVEEQTHTIKDYDGKSKVATVETDWGSPVPTSGSYYKITNEECLRRETGEFKEAFCAKPLPCPDCCPEEHYIILGSFKMDINQKTIQQVWFSEKRSYVPTIHLFQYIFSSLLNGINTFFEVTEDGESKPIPDVNLSHTNPIAALCWLGQMFIEQVDIKPNNETEISRLTPRKARIQPVADPEVAKLREEVDELKKIVAVEELKRKEPKKEKK